MAILVYPRWPPAAILYCWKPKFSPLDWPSPETPPRTKHYVSMLNRTWIMPVLIFLKDDGCPLFLILLCSFRTICDDILVVLNVHSNFQLIDLICCFENIAISILLTFGLRLPNHAHFFIVLEVLIPWANFVSETLKRLIGGSTIWVYRFQQKLARLWRSDIIRIEWDIHCLILVVFQYFRSLRSSVVKISILQ